MGRSRYAYFIGNGTLKVPPGYPGPVLGVGTGAGSAGGIGVRVSLNNPNGGSGGLAGGYFNPLVSTVAPNQTGVATVGSNLSSSAGAGNTTLVIGAATVVTASGYNSGAHAGEALQINFPNCGTAQTTKGPAHGGRGLWTGWGDQGQGGVGGVGNPANSNSTVFGGGGGGGNSGGWYFPGLNPPISGGAGGAAGDDVNVVAGKPGDPGGLGSGGGGGGAPWNDGTQAGGGGHGGGGQAFLMLWDLASPASISYSTASTWRAPPGYSGPVLVTGTSTGLISPPTNQNTGRIFVVAANAAYAVDPSNGSFNGVSISSGTACVSSSMNVAWWPGMAAHLVFTGSGTWHSPPGNKGPVLYHSTDVSASFDGVRGSFVDQNGTVTAVQAAVVDDNTDHAIVVPDASRPMTVVWFP